MNLGLNTWLTDLTQQWVKKRSSFSNPQHLTSKRIYILPSAFGWLYGFVIITITIGAINYQLNTAYFFVFLLAIIALLSMWQTHQNIKDISIQCMQIDDVEQGHPAKVTLFIYSKDQPRYALIFSYKKGEVVTLEHTPAKGGKIILPIATPARGKFKLPPIKIYSYYPLGIFRVWTYLYFDLEYYVYPAARSPGFWPNAITQQSQQENLMYHPGEDELYELKSVDNPWVQASRIAWKISARGQGWYLKTLTSPAGEYWLFSLDALKTRDIETDLQHLSYWIQTADQQRQAYALELGDNITKFAFGAEHRKHCLRKLAVY